MKLTTILQLNEADVPNFLWKIVTDFKEKNNVDFDVRWPGFKSYRTPAGTQWKSPGEIKPHWRSEDDFEPMTNLWKVIKPNTKILKGYGYYMGDDKVKAVIIYIWKQYYFIPRMYTSKEVSSIEYGHINRLKNPLSFRKL